MKKIQTCLFSLSVNRRQTGQKDIVRALLQLGANPTAAAADEEETNEENLIANHIQDDMKNVFITALIQAITASK